MEVHQVYASTEGVQQYSPGQSAAPPWVEKCQADEPCKGVTIAAPNVVSPFQGFIVWTDRDPRAALRSALGSIVAHLRCSKATRNRFLTYTCTAEFALCRIGIAV
jgi:hypothetical protein